MRFLATFQHDHPNLVRGFLVVAGAGLTALVQAGLLPVSALPYAALALKLIGAATAGAGAVNVVGRS